MTLGLIRMSSDWQHLVTQLRWLRPSWRDERSET